MVLPWQQCRGSANNNAHHLGLNSVWTYTLTLTANHEGLRSQVYEALCIRKLNLWAALNDVWPLRGQRDSTNLLKHSSNGSQVKEMVFWSEPLQCSMAYRFLTQSREFHRGMNTILPKYIMIYFDIRWAVLSKDVFRQKAGLQLDVAWSYTKSVETCRRAARM